jgi:hypothetical protein
MPKFGEPVYLPLIDISAVSHGDYRVEISIISGEKLVLSDLGYKYPDFISHLYAARNVVIVKHLLISENLRKPAISGDLIITTPPGQLKNHGACEIRLYDTSIVFMPSDADPIRMHFSNISQIEAKDYSIAISASKGETAIISKLGNQYDNLARDLSEAMNELHLQTLTLLKELSPSASPTTMGSLSRIMKDGKPAKSSDIKSISSSLWRDLEKRIEESRIGAEYQYLKSLARADMIAVGVKRGLMGELTGNYLWVGLPIYGNDNRNGNAIAVESVKISSAAEKDQDPDQPLASNTGGNATYFFRIVETDQYSKIVASGKAIDAEVENIIQTLGQLMLDVNFRREPIYLSDDRIRNDPQYAKYRYATQNIVSLKDLRKLFIGRVIHSSFEQWKSDVTSLLAFNMTAPIGVKWEKA